MRIKIVDVVLEGRHLEVIFDRDDWLSTPEGLRAVRILKHCGSTQVSVYGRKLVVWGAADKSVINTKQACQAELNRWADQMITFDFSFIVMSSARQLLKNMREVRVALADGFRVMGTLKAHPNFPLLRQDFDALVAEGYGAALAHSPNEPYTLSFQLPVTGGANPWEMLEKLKADIARLIK